MQLKKINLYNFRSFVGEHEIELKPGTWFLLGDNGAGKSTVVGAIAWVVCGELATGACRDRLISYGKEEMSVELTLDEMIIKRSRSKHRSRTEILEYWTDETGWVRGDLIPTQERLNQALNLSPRLFFSALWLDQSSATVQFLWRKPAERLQILQELIDEGFFQDLRKFVHTKKVGYEKGLIKLEERERSLDEFVGVSKARIAQIDVDLYDEQERLSTAQEKALEQGWLLQEEIEKKSIEVSLLEADISIESKNINVPINTLLGNCAELEARINMSKEIYGKLFKGGLGSKCPTCEKEITADDYSQLDRHKKETYSEITRLTNLLTTENKRKKQVQDATKIIDKAKVSIQSLTGEIRSLQRQLTSVENSDHNTESVQRLQRTLKVEQDTLVKRVTELAEVRNTLEEYRILLPRYKFWEDGFGSRGIQNLLLDDVRNLLDQFTQNYISYLDGENIKILFPQSETGFDIDIQYRGNQASPETLSGGQRGRVNGAVMLGLRETLLHLRASKIDMIVLDDPFVCLDKSGKDSIVELAQQLSGKISHVFITLPEDHPGIRPSQVIRVNYKDGESSIA